ncbi:MAG: thermonuclease family protein [Nitrospirota bacterium]|nr:thermonuclease family protein [Nitrospirota bacterium]
MNGIDCPEKGQAFGKKAKQFTSEMVFEKDVMVQSYRLDRYGRTIADIVLTDGTNLNRELVKAGLAWRYVKYSRTRR